MLIPPSTAGTVVGERFLRSVEKSLFCGIILFDKQEFIEQSDKLKRFIMRGMPMKIRKFQPDKNLQNLEIYLRNQYCQNKIYLLGFQNSSMI